MNKQQLANRIWASANKLRSKIDANDYKDYILGLIFYKFLSDTEVKFLKEKMGLENSDMPEVKEDFTNPDMADLIDRCQKEIGFFISYDNLFSTWLEKDDLNVVKLSEALKDFERLMSSTYKPVFEHIFDTLSGGLTKLGENPGAQTRTIRDLAKLIKVIPTDGKEDYDVLGYVYEYLISNFAASAGKKAGEFYTPHEVAMVMSEIVAEHHKNKKSIEIYDPTSGSGSLLITIGKAMARHMDGKNRVKYYAQELKENTYNLTRMNLVMRGIIPQNIVTRNADTLEEDWPLHMEGEEIDQPLAVDAVVSNPPYSQHWDPKDKELDSRFKEYGVAPKTKADYAFLLHELHHLKADGIMTIVLPHGVLFRGKAPKIYSENGELLALELQEEGQAEGKIRASLIEKNNIDAIIGLPAGIFFGTGIPTIIMVLKKNRKNEGILIIDASKGYVKEGTQNRLRTSDIKRISDTYRDRISIPGYSREVSRDEVRRNDYNLNIPRYVDGSERGESHDIYASMFGGIPDSEIDELNEYWETFPTLRNQLFGRVEGEAYPRPVTEDIKGTINENADVMAYRDRFSDTFGPVRDLLKIRLIDHVENVKEAQEEAYITADLMLRGKDVPLTDPYGIYQIFSDHWDAIMGDIEIIQSEGFKACNEIETNYKTIKKDGIEDEVPDGEKGRIFPFDLVQKTYLSDKLEELEGLRRDLEQTEAEMSELLESLDDDQQEALLNEDNTKWDGKRITAAFNAICDEYCLKGNKVKKETAFAKMNFEEGTLEWNVKRIKKLLGQEADLKREVRQKSVELHDATIGTIQGLDMKQIVELLQLKWIEPIAGRIDDTPDQILSGLSKRIKVLSEKYSETLLETESKIKATEMELASMIENLTGTDLDMAGLKEFQKLLRHE